LAPALLKALLLLRVATTSPLGLVSEPVDIKP
jgi:hypothetical protein